MKHKTPAEYHELATKRGFRWLGPPVSNVWMKTSWQCDSNSRHIFEANFHDLGVCPCCPRPNKLKTEEDYHALARERGVEWLGPSVTSTREKTNWKCAHDHVWAVCYGRIKAGNGCPYCAHRVQKTEDDYHALAADRDYRWLGPTPANVHSKTNWQCKQGHTWESRFNSIQRGVGCPHCSGLFPKKDDDYHTLARKRGFRWLGPKTSSVLTKTTWQCERGHTWKASFNTVQGGHGCPHCVDMFNGMPVSRPQRALCDILAGNLNHHVGNYAIDIAIHKAGVSIAVEYDSWFWHAHKSDYDARRDQDLITAGWRVLRVKSRKQLPTQDQLDAAIAVLIDGEAYAEIVLDDWGIGPTSIKTHGT